MRSEHQRASGAGARRAPATLLVIVGAVALLGMGGFAILLSELSACSGDGGSAHALPGSAQLSYCNSKLELLALAAPIPLLVEGLRREHGSRRLGMACLFGILIASTPIIAAFVLPDA